MIAARGILDKVRLGLRWFREQKWMFCTVCVVGRRSSIGFSFSFPRAGVPSGYNQFGFKAKAEVLMLKKPL